MLVLHKMSQITIVRHGQASFGADDYDQLSALGKKQALALGDYFVKQKRTFDSIYLGDLKRHKQTLDQIQKAFQLKDIVLPQATVLPGLNEHHGPRIVRKHFEKLKKEDSPMGEWARAFEPQKGASPKYFRYYNKITSAWSKGEIQDEEIESWSDFRLSVESALSRIRSENKGSKNILVVSSGGPLSVFVGTSFVAKNEDIMSMAQLVYNCAYAQLLYSGERINLQSFNRLAFTNPELISLV